MKKLLPSDGGCWFCCRDNTDCFSIEFDTYYHLECLKEQIAANSELAENQEVTIMARERNLHPYGVNKVDALEFEVERLTKERNHYKKLYEDLKNIRRNYDH